MTFKEWMEKNKPEYVDKRCIAGVVGCPYEYGLEAEEESVKNCDTTKKGWECCEQCWNREMPEESSVEKSLEYFKKKLSKTLSDECREAYQDAVEALEKQLPKKGIKEKITEGANKGLHKYYCPVCYAKGDLSNKCNVGEYCSDCGQRLDWSE